MTTGDNMENAGGGQVTVVLYSREQGDSCNPVG